MANNSVPAVPTLNALAADQHFIETTWREHPLPIGVANRLMAADLASRGARAVLAILRRDAIARADIENSADEQNPLIYPLLGIDEVDGLFTALQCLLDQADQMHTEVRENLHGIAKASAGRKANG